jgi:hypothetical protein
VSERVGQQGSPERIADDKRAIGEATQLELQIAKMIPPYDDWWKQWTDDPESHGLNNYPGQHWSYRRRSVELAREIITLVRADRDN